jgi:hypothetical protein
MSAQNEHCASSLIRCSERGRTGRTPDVVASSRVVSS